MNTFCYNCKNRHVLCHKDCKDYEQYRNRLDVIKINKNNEADKYIQSKSKLIQSIRRKGDKNG